MPFVYSGVDFHCLLLSPRKRAIIFCKLISTTQRVTYQTCAHKAALSGAPLLSGSTPTFETLAFIPWSLCECTSSLDFSVLGVKPCSGFDHIWDTGVYIHSEKPGYSYPCVHSKYSYPSRLITASC